MLEMHPDLGPYSGSGAQTNTAKLTGELVCCSINAHIGWPPIGDIQN